MARTPMSDDDLERTMRTLPAWEVRGGAIHRTFTFTDFSEAWAFMSRVALAAEAANHHPDWSNSWNTVDIALTTHDVGGLTHNDIALARAIDDLFR